MRIECHTPGGNTHAQKEMGRPGESAPKQNDHGNSSNPAPLMGWHELAKPSRDRQPKQRWRRKAGGAIDAVLLGLLAFLAVMILLHTEVI
ncbi:MAG: hypothetical protein JSS57_02500 [Proteobacteria bacterium]|nr:hypothetical protein [Pseudomonadota bacterium]